MGPTEGYSVLHDTYTVLLSQEKFHGSFLHRWPAENKSNVHLLGTNSGPCDLRRLSVFKDCPFFKKTPESVPVYILRLPATENDIPLFYLVALKYMDLYMLCLFLFSLIISLALLVSVSPCYCWHVFLHVT